MSERDVEIAIYESHRAHELELDKATAAFEHATLSPLFLLNGGSAVAFLTLLGTDVGNSLVDLRTAVVAVAVWSFGLLSAAQATRLGHRAQREFTHAVRERRLTIENALLSADSVLRGKLKIPSGDSPEDLHKSARALRQRYDTLAGVSVWLFVAGVLAAGVAVLLATP